MGLPLRPGDGLPGEASTPFFLLCLRKASSNTTPALASLSHDTDPGRTHTGLPGLRQGWPGCPTDCSGPRTRPVLPPKPHCEPWLSQAWTFGHWATLCCAAQTVPSIGQKGPSWGAWTAHAQHSTGLAPLGGPPRCSAGLRAPAAPPPVPPSPENPWELPLSSAGPSWPHPCPGHCPSQVQPGSSSWPTAHTDPTPCGAGYTQAMVRPGAQRAAGGRS